MLDENLPTFFFKASTDTPLSTPIFLRQDGSDLQPEYLLRRPDTNLPASKNCYAVALYDSCNPEVLYAEVLVQPEWTQPSLSQAEIRAQNGIPPPPVPIVPQSFTVQLYNPDQQVLVKQIPSSWNSSAYWEFDMPQISFRAPSASALDRSQSDPAMSDFTPKVAFKWKRDGKFSKDLSCFLVGETAEGRRNKEPDIPIAMFKGGKDLTIYEPNMHRVDVEDFKGLEVVLLLSAPVIKDIFFNPTREMFNISSPNTNPGPSRKRNNSGPVIRENGRTAISPVMAGGLITNPPPRRTSYPLPPGPSLPSTVNPRTQWEIDTETARLKALVEAEERERQHLELIEEQRIKKMLEEEEKEQRRRDAEIAKETERLRKQYGITPTPVNGSVPGSSRQRIQFAPQQVPLRPTITTTTSSAQPPPKSRPLSMGPSNFSLSNGWFGGSSSSQPKPQKQQQQGQGHSQSQSPYLQAPGNGAASSSGFFGGKKMQKKRSVFF
ncbi:ce3887b7-d1e6-4b91-b1f8-b20876530720-CDS [Sclerotinia trifoliorum]|uniref:Ce3887b7-d1e6-4b91-b1f8-b20876530720-CDS n=1 Tax=Sclerotinia trifoliorum TaxID=28548 RepID=A0A8H2VTS9_9HELO|nr:ce3887b7-d1e6-4b91-b1f8-b20876530720-CDS [Sclerotinia trifoliorum]